MTSTQLTGRPVDRPGGPQPERRPRHLPRASTSGTTAAPQLRLYKRTAGTFTQLGTSYNSGPLPAGTKLTLPRPGSTISFQQNGTERIVVTDSSLTGGAPGR